MTTMHRPMGKMSPLTKRTMPTFSSWNAAVDEATAPSPMNTPAAMPKTRSRHAGLWAFPTPAAE